MREQSPGKHTAACEHDAKEISQRRQTVRGFEGGGGSSSGWVWLWQPHEPTSIQSSPAGLPADQNAVQFLTICIFSDDQTELTDPSTCSQPLSAISVKGERTQRSCNLPPSPSPLCMSSRATSRIDGFARVTHIRSPEITCQVRVLSVTKCHPDSPTLSKARSAPTMGLGTAPSGDVDPVPSLLSTPPV